MAPARTEPSAPRIDPGASVVTTAQTASALLEAGRSISVHDETTPRTQPPRSAKTGTIARQTAVMKRAVELAGLARSNLSFFEEAGLSRGSPLEEATEAVRGIDALLSRNRQEFEEAARRNAAFLRAELKSIDGEVARLEKQFRKARERDDLEAIEGAINLAQLRSLRLQELLTDAEALVGFFHRPGARTRTRSSRKGGA